MDCADRRSSCSFLAGLLGDRLIGTANKTAAWILVEHGGPWGKNALRDSDLDPVLVAEFERRMAATGARVQLIAPPPGERPLWMYLAADPDGGTSPWLARLPCSGPQDVLGVDFGTLVAGGLPPGAQRVAEPLYLICANDMSDPCCGRSGPPVLAAVAGVLGPRARATTHLGGHKYAANMIVFPPALCYGRLGPDSVLDVVGASEDGQILLDRYRGRPAWRMPDQAAEHFLRVELGLTAVAGVSLATPAEDSTDGRYLSRFALSDRRRYDVLLSAEKRDPPRLQSCSDAGPTVPVVWICDGILLATDSDD
ncbi:MAG TPA: sucrase ferredoxin [Micromonosporaceae bacterium]|jgi:hypothetical protein|nr:sucrase ferredoxin [Micromonosporaceae bacterium]